METKKILASLLATMLIAGSIWTTFAWDDEGGERGEHNSERSEHRSERSERNHSEEKN